MINTVEKKPVEFTKGFEVTVRIDGTVQEYAMSFLHIFNNVKENDELVRVTNDYKNNVSVVCYADALEATKSYLRQFGEIAEVCSALIVSLAEEDIEYDYSKYDTIACDFREI